LSKTSFKERFVTGFFILGVNVYYIYDISVLRFQYGLTRAYFKQNLQLHKTWHSASWQCNNYTLYTAYFDFKTAQIV